MIRDIVHSSNKFVERNCVVNYLNEDGYESRIADSLMNDSYYSDLLEEPEHKTSKLTKEEESVIVNRLIELMTGKRSKKRAKV